MSTSNWRSNFPYPQARSIQTETLQALEDNWEKYDCFVIQAPTAFGKTALARTLQNMNYSVSVITPTNLLVDQFLEEFPDTPSMHRLDSYKCEKWDRPCPVTRSKLAGFCKGCPAGRDLARAKYRNGPGIYNYHTYLAHKLYRKVLVVDEAHNLVPTIQDRMGIRLWQHDYKYPHNMFRPDQVQKWTSSLSDTKKKSKKIQALLESAKYGAPEYIFQRTQEWFNGKGTLRDQPELRDVIKLLPVDISDAPPMFWPGLARGRDQSPSGGAGAVEKIVLMSATISKKDITRLGLGGRRVLYIECKSPIPGGNRPIIIDPVVSVNRQFLESGNMDQLVSYIRNVASYHQKEKGLVHATYQLAELLRPHLESDPRFMFHDRENKAQVYQEFRNSNIEDGKILIGCGLYEGVDLPEDLGRFQIIAKVPWQSLQNPAIKLLSVKDPEWYNWETVKVFVQACGRICRTPTDRGITYCPDSSFLRLWHAARDLFPKWLLEAVEITK